LWVMSDHSMTTGHSRSGRRPTKADEREHEGIAAAYGSGGSLRASYRLRESSEMKMRYAISTTAILVCTLAFVLVQSASARENVPLKVALNTYKAPLGEKSVKTPRPKRLAAACGASGLSCSNPTPYCCWSASRGYYCVTDVNHC
jgi:hypothetical protein